MINSHFFTNTLYAKNNYKSARGYLYYQLFVSDKDSVYTVPMKKGGDFPLALKEFVKEIGMPTSLILDPWGGKSSNEVNSLRRSVLCL